MDKNKLIDSITNVLILITALVILVFQKNILNVFLGICGCCVGLGICFTLKKEQYGYAVSGFGISGLLSYLFYNLDLLNFDDSITFMVASTFGITCLFTIIVDMLFVKLFNKKYSMVVVGKVIDLEVNKNNSKYYRPIYGYKIDKSKYEVAYPQYMKKKIPAIGDDMPIFLNPDDYGDVYFKRDKISSIKTYFVSSLLLIICIGIIIGLFI